MDRTTQKDLRIALARLAMAMGVGVVGEQLDPEAPKEVPEARWLPNPPRFDRPALTLDRSTQGWAVALVGTENSQMDLTVLSPQYLPVGELYRMCHAAARVLERQKQNRDTVVVELPKDVAERLLRRSEAPAAQEERVVGRRSSTRRVG